MQAGRDAQNIERASSRCWYALVPLTLWCLASAGCAGFWDDITSRDYSFKHAFRKSDPMLVLRDSTDGDRRARALRALKEPQQNGGSSEEQNVVVEVLCRAASSERQALSRLAAIHTLRDFRDPRVSDGLKEAYYRSSSFNPETAAVIRCAALEALGHVGQPAGVELLVKVLREPPVEGAEVDRQLKADERIAAARALGKLNRPEATQALVEVLQSEKDVALRSRAHESLVLCTGKRLPPDAKIWSDYLRDPVATERALAGTRSWKDNLLEVVPVSWWR